MESRILPTDSREKYRETVAVIRNLTYIPFLNREPGIDPQHLLNLSTNEFIKTNDNELYPERSACAQIIIEAFFESEDYKSWKLNAYENIAKVANDSFVRNFNFAPIIKETKRINTCFDDFIENIRKQIDLSPEKYAVEILDEITKVLAYRRDPSNTEVFDAKKIIRNGLGTSTTFAIKMMETFSGKRNILSNAGIKEKDAITPDKISKSIRDTLVVLGTLFASFRLSDHTTSLLLLSNKESSGNIPVQILHLITSFNSHNFSGRIENGEPLKPKPEILTRLKALLKRSQNAIRCPALTRAENGSPLHDYMTTLANFYLLQSEIINLEDLK